MHHVSMEATKKKMNKAILYAIVLILLGCNGSSTSNGLASQAGKGITRQAYLNSLDSADLMNGLIFWTSDTAFASDAKLMFLVDTLYRHVREGDFAAQVKEEEMWMAEYRTRLCAYYDAHPLGSDTISAYAKADSVLNEATRLLELGNQWSTMETTIYNDAVFAFDRYREFELLTRLANCCENEEAKELVYKEWTLYEKILKKAGPVISDIICLNSYGGSICGPFGTSAYLQISNAHREMYQTMLDIVKDEGWKDIGVPLECADRFLFDCFSASIERIIKVSDGLYRNEGNKPSAFRNTIDKTKVAIKELPPIIKEWMQLMDKLDEKMTHDYNRHSFERAAAYMLMNWASIATSELP